MANGNTLEQLLDCKPLTKEQEQAWQKRVAIYKRIVGDLVLPWWKATYSQEEPTQYVLCNVTEESVMRVENNIRKPYKTGSVQLDEDDTEQLIQDLTTEFLTTHWDAVSEIVKPSLNWNKEGF